MSSLFITYRRCDSLETVGRLYEHLKSRLKRWDIFYDHKHLQPGSDFPDELRRQVSSAKVVLVIIGPEWLKLLKERQGQPLTDHVFEEVRLALQSGNTVLPVLIRNAVMPIEYDLESFPELLPLLRKNGRSVRPDPDFDNDVEMLAAFLDETIQGVGPGLLLGGKYKLARQVGEGGMGVVYEAVDVSVKTSRARVAVKMILEGMNTKEVLARFDGEKEALARMKHDHIAKVLDSGATPQGRPYFVMEFVAGEPITDYCDRKRLTPQERLRLFQKVCSAVQHAHTKGIVHRDIKPSNVLVEEVDGQPVPKVIDFGLAKALTGKLTDQTQQTSYSRAVGTLLYMSPEQAAGRAQEIDTRTDVYSLGVLLYELLAGEPPFTQAELLKIGDQAVRDAIIQNDPPRPSTKLSSSHSRPAISANRQIDPAKLTTLLKNELEWLPLKAMAKEPDHRYETPSQFSEDIDSYLNHERTIAGKPTPTQQLRKYLIRKRGPVIAASLIFVSLLAGLVSTVWQRQRADANATLARQNEARALAQAARAEAGEKLAKEKEANALAANAEKQQALIDLTNANYLVFRIFDDFDVRKVKAQGTPIEAALADRLVAAGQQLTETIRDPLVRSGLQDRLGETLLGLGQADEAIELLEVARASRANELGSHHHITLTSTNNLARSYRAAGRLDLALPLYEETLCFRKAKLPSDHPDVLISMNNLAGAYRDTGRLDLALPLYEEALTLLRAKSSATSYDITLISLNNLGLAYRDAAKLDLAVPLLEEALTLSRAEFGPDHPDTLTTMHNLGLSYQTAGKLDLALPLFEETLTLFKTKLGPDHPDTLTCMTNLAVGYQDAGKWDLVLPLFEDALPSMKSKLGPDHPTTLTCMNNLAFEYRRAGKLDLALPLFEETLALRKAKLGPDHPSTLISMNNLALGYMDTLQLGLAVPLFEETLILFKAKLGSDHPNTLTCMLNLANSYKAAEKLDLAIPLFEETLPLIKAKLGPDHSLTLTGMNNLAIAFVDAQRSAEAVPLFQGYLEQRRKVAKPNDPAFAGDLAVVSLHLLRGRQFEAAEPLLRECLAIREKTQPDNWTTFNTQSLLGGALLGQKKLADAESLLLKGYEGMQAREETIPAQGIVRIAEALDRLIELFTATDRLDEAKKYQELRAKYPAAEVKQP